MEIVIMMDILLLAIAGLVSSDSICDNLRRTLDVVPDPEHCEIFYICFNKKKLRLACGMPGGHLVFDPKSKNCVKKGSEFDNCNKLKNYLLPSRDYASYRSGYLEVLDGENGCKAGVEDIYADETNCAKYFECPASRLVDGKPLKKECPYPRLYDRKKRSCEPYVNVECDNRFEPKDPCAYESNSCVDSVECRPCRARFGTCIDLKDGLNAWKGREWTPAFVICKEERVVFQGDCKYTGRLQLFHPILKQCLDLWAMARGFYQTSGLTKLNTRSQ